MNEMIRPIDRPGTFRGQIKAFHLEKQKSPSKALALVIQADLYDKYDFDQKAWEDWQQFQFEAEGRVWLVKKDGMPNESAARQLATACGWSGQLEHFDDGSWSPAQCQFSIKPNEYQGNVTHQISFLNPWDQEPGRFGQLDQSELSAMSTQYGSQFRAMVGSATANASRPQGAPPAPPPAPYQAVPQSQSIAPDEVPF